MGLSEESMFDFRCAGE